MPHPSSTLWFRYLKLKNPKNNCILLWQHKSITYNMLTMLIISYNSFKNLLIKSQKNTRIVNRTLNIFILKIVEHIFVGSGMVRYFIRKQQHVCLFPWLFSHLNFLHFVCSVILWINRIVIRIFLLRWFLNNI